MKHDTDELAITIGAMERIAFETPMYDHNRRVKRLAEEAFVALRRVKAEAEPHTLRFFIEEARSERERG